MNDNFLEIYLINSDNVIEIKITKHIKDASK